MKRFTNQALAICLSCIGVSAAGCSMSGGIPGSGEPVTEKGEAITAAGATAPAPVPQEITIVSTPHAKCTLRASSATTSPQSAPVWADDVGLVHLWAPPASVSEMYSLDCSAGGDTAQHSFDLANAATFLPAAAPAAAVGRKTRPALTNPTTLTQAELFAAGYPPRPDPTLAPSLYGKWLKIVSIATTLIPPHLVERSDLHFGAATNKTSTRWTGIALNTPATRYIVVAGAFGVPTGFLPPGGAASSNVATWVGLDGWSNADVVQDGVDYATTGTVGSYSAWYEYYPSAPVFNTSMVVHPDDTMQFWSWECDSTGVHGAGHTGYGCFWYQNETTNVSAGGFIVRAPNGLFQGLTAEGVIERQPGIPLSLFSQSDVEFDATDTSGATHNVNSDAYLNITLINNSGATMAHTNYYISPDVILFTWNRSL